MISIDHIYHQSESEHRENAGLSMDYLAMNLTFFSDLKEVRCLNKDAAFFNNHLERLQSVG